MQCGRLNKLNMLFWILLMNTKTYRTVFRVDPFKMQEKRSKKKSAIGILTK